MDISERRMVIEGLVFASDTPVRADHVAEALEISPSEAQRILRELQDEYDAAGRGFVLQEVAGGFQFRTRPEHALWLRRFKKNRVFRFSRAALETLAIIAYRQPVTRADIDYLRGVDSGGVLKTLLDKRLVRICGKKDLPGRPLIYGTSREFLELFGLMDLTGLPLLKEFTDLPPEWNDELESLLKKDQRAS